MACWKALWISHPPKKFQKIQLQIGIVIAYPKSLNSIYGTHNPLEVKIYVQNQVSPLGSRSTISDRVLEARLTEYYVLGGS
jgi:hypothetical protein